MRAGCENLIGDPARVDAVAVIGVDEHVWSHTRRGDKYVTVIIDLSPIRDGTGPARLLDMVESRAKAAFKTWLAARPQAWRDGVQVVAMDGFTGFKTATSEELPDAVAVMDPFHVVRLAGDALDRCRRRVQNRTCTGYRGRAHDPLYRARRTLHTGVGLLTDRQQSRLEALFALNEHVQVQATWGIYPADDHGLPSPGRTRGRELMEQLMARATGPPKAINGRLEHLRGTALGFRNLTHYIARSLLETGGFRPRLHPQS